MREFFQLFHHDLSLNFGCIKVRKRFFFQITTVTASKYIKQKWDSVGLGIIGWHLTKKLTSSSVTQP